MALGELDLIFSSLDHQPQAYLTPQQASKKKKRIWAKRMRVRPTKAEKKLWVHIKNSRMLGFHFCSQHIIKGFIADFACPSLKLVIEVDGPTHDTRQSYDAKRTETLNHAGWIVLRFKNEEVFNHIRSVKRKISTVIQQLSQSL